MKVFALFKGAGFKGVFDNREFAMSHAIKDVDARQPGKWRGKREVEIIAKYNTFTIFTVTHEAYGSDWKVVDCEVNELMWS